jgi:hypothetical protein
MIKKNHESKKVSTGTPEKDNCTRNSNTLQYGCEEMVFTGWKGLGTCNIIANPSKLRDPDHTCYAGDGIGTED